MVRSIAMKNNCTTSIINYATITFAGCIRNNLLMIALLSAAGQEAYAQAPGGVSANLELWLRADDLPVGNIVAPGWVDRSLDNNTFEAVFSDPQVIAGSSYTLNFNPYVNFDGNDYLLNTDGNFVGNNTAGDVFTVVKNNGLISFTPFDNGHPFDLGGASSSHYTYRDQAIYEDYGSTDRFGFNPNTGTILDSKTGVASVLEKGIQPFFFNIYNVHSDTNNWRLSFNNLTTAQSATNSVDFTLSNYEHIGARSGAAWKGDMPEIINYSRVLTDAEKNRVNSYLAIRYGITLGNTTASVSYVDSAGNNIWDATANSAYHNNVAGLGKDDSSALDQRISKSINLGSIVTMATNSDFTSANTVGSRISLTDKQFLVWGTNGEEATLSTTEVDLTQFTARIPREWKVQNTNSVGAVFLKFNGYGGTSNVKYYLLTKQADANFSTGATNQGVLNSDGELTSDGISPLSITLANGTFFTLAMKTAAAPGGVFIADAPVNGVAYTLFDNIALIQNNTLQTGYVNDFLFVDDVFLDEITDYFGLILKTHLKVDIAGSYTFKSVAIDDDFMLYIDGVLYSNYSAHPLCCIDITGPPINLSEGMHTLELRYANYDGTENLRIDYSGPDTGGGFISIPATKLFTNPILSTWHKADAGVSPSGNGSVVTNWLDQGPNKVDLSNVYSDNNYYNLAPLSTNPPDNLFNFNPIINTIDDQFASADQASGLPYNKQARTAFMVTGRGETNRNHIFGYGRDTNGQQFIIQENNSDLQIDFYGNSLPGSNSNTFLTSSSLIRTQTGTPNTAGVSNVKGSLSGILNINATANFSTRLNDQVDFSIGNAPDLPKGQGFIGITCEVILYPWELSSNEINRVESYLAIKYGFTLGNATSPISYLDSSSNTIWDATTNSAYHNDVAGIGRDDASALDQRISKSVNNGTIVTMATNNDFTSSNIDASRTSLTDKQFLVWGNDRGNINASTINLPIGSSSISLSEKRINRTWKVVESGGDIPTVRVAVQNSALSSLGGLLPDEYYIMVVADDAGLTTNVQHIPMDAGTINVAGKPSRTTTYDFNGEKYFTFAKIGTHEEPLHMIFDGVDDAIAVNKNVVEGSAYTLMAWVKLNGPNALNGNRTILAKHNGTNGYKLAIKNDNTVVFTLGGTPILNSTVALPNGVWHHLTVTYNGSTAKLYIDGVLADSGAASPSTAANAYFAMGAVYETASPTNLFKGNLDEVRVFNKVLSQDQFRFIINQEIIKDGTAIKGAIIPTSISKYDISGLPYNDLAAYFNMNVYGLDAVMDVSNNAHRGYIAPTVGVDLAPQRPPLPYQTRADGSWNVDTIWSASSDVYIPGSASIVDPNITVDWNIVETTNNVTMNNSSLPNGSNNRTLLSLEVQSNTLSVANASALSITHNLSLYGKIDLQGEAQLIQTNDSDLDTSSPGSIERDQQGTLDKYTYNYWSSPVGALGTLANNQAISLKNVLKDGTNPNAPQTINWAFSYSAASPSSPITMSSYWVYNYLNSAWSQVRETGTIQPGVGFTSKGVGTGVSTDQNYVFVGKPNNGNISVTLNAGKEHLIGNPYPSALDANQFIDDNIAIANGGNNTTDVIEGTLYFWEHWGGGSHIQREYQGGYATLTKAGGVKAIVHPKVSDLGGTVGTKEPKQFIPVAQGFLVNAVNGGTLKFNNGQRVFKTEGTASVFLRAAAPVKEQAKVATEDTRMKIWLKIKAGTGVERELLLAFDTNTTVGYDNGYDGAIADAHTSDHYWPLGDRKLVINALPQWSEDLEVPVGLISEKPGSSEFFISRLENVPESTPLYILDKDTGLTHDLRAANVVLPITQGEFNNRFQLVFKPSVSLSNTQEEIQQDFQIITKDKGIEIVNHKGLQIQQVKVHNIIGQQILEQDYGLNNGKLTTINLEVATGVYLVRVRTANGTWTKKVLMQ